MAAKTENLSYQLCVDTFVGIAAGFSLSWFITPMDIAVMESMASNKQITLKSSLQTSLKQIFGQPHRYMAQPLFGYVFGTYSATYLAKNYIDTICKKTNQNAEQTAFYKFWLVFAVNGGLSVFWKDVGLAKIIKQNVAALNIESTVASSVAKVPSMRMTYACWMSRDILHMLGSAVLPDYIEQKYDLTHQQWGFAQLTFPVLTQLVTTPFHLMGLDYFNGESVTMKDRFKNIRKQYFGAVGVRMVRMWAPWSIGLVINRELRDYLNGEEHDDSS